MEADGCIRLRARDRTGLGRKRAIQVLEYFGRVGYTRKSAAATTDSTASRGDLAVNWIDFEGRMRPRWATGLKTGTGPSSGPWWVRLPFSSATLSGTQLRHTLGDSTMAPAARL